MLSGYKTYIIAIGMALYALSAWGLGHIDANEAMRLLMEAAAFAGLRAGVSNAVTKGK